jgi:transglutaminase-like putative cysteine protease
VRRDPKLRRWLEPDRLVPIGGAIRELAEDVTRARTTPLARARAIYDYSVSTLKYDKSGTGWGRGDIYYACDVKRGNCTDFHSVFTGFARALGIPARFEIGFPLPADRSEGEIAGYHCWAQFWLDGFGWVPVDASEANKNPSRREYFFGAHDEHRVLLTTGRDIRLEPPQKGAPLNYFIYPYAEIDGKQAANVGKRFSFKDVKTATTASAEPR